MGELQETNCKRKQRKKTIAFARRFILRRFSTLIVHFNFSSSRSFMFFWRPKERKAPAHGKSSRHLLCSGVASNILQSKSPCHLNLSVDFWVMRTFLS